MEKKKLFLRTLMVLFWIVLLFGMLYSPYFFKTEHDKSINVFIWSGMLDLHYISKFEEKTGIKVRFSHYESNEELLVKLRATKGEGYDLIVPGDYAVNILRNEHLLKKLDKSKLNFLSKLNPILLNHYYDPNNDYTVPAEWSVFGIGIDKDYFHEFLQEHKNKEFSWDLILAPQLRPGISHYYNVIMSNDPLVSIPIAAIYLFGSLDNLNVAKLERVKELLIKQKKFVEAYVDFRPDYYLATKNCHIAFSASSYIWRSVYEYPHIDFIIPTEGTIINIENYALPITTRKEDLVYQFLNFIMEPETAKHHFESEGTVFPVTVDVIPELNLKDSIKKLLTITPEEFKKFTFLRLDLLPSPIDENYLQDLWIKIKS